MIQRSPHHIIEGRVKAISAREIHLQLDELLGSKTKIAIDIRPYWKGVHPVVQVHATVSAEVILSSMQGIEVICVYTPSSSNHTQEFINAYLQQ
ncbi:hypothetical protein QCD60_03460 [Pokkaliibacter sp. MBI-7]|uniref:Uncharacterized protein n=1 Tax=Proteobacteria bacterium 228 TaxID=2083153 RepID=A0A2S5KJY5_9PROT|nr:MULTISPECIES: hypothetical protein [Pokkaliibacter]MDH2431610.1 hypothetical protein [Pokkaliibacter sp. MBI-7]PPC74819.1 hypothetical protein C4K68_24150 [Pokkaliibacter plantistimulans]